MQTILDTDNALRLEFDSVDEARTFFDQARAGFAGSRIFAPPCT